MRLVDLDPRFLKVETERSFRDVDDIAAADGIVFLCPKCLGDNGGQRPGVHSIICWQPHIPQTIPPTPGRWSFVGTGIEDLTLKAGSSSIALTSGCCAHFYITAGGIVWC